MMTQVSGIVNRIIYNNDDFYIINITLKDGTALCTTVNHPNIKIGFNGDFNGEYIDHASFGKQFKAQFVIEKLPETKEGFKQYLTSGVFKGVGAVTAKKIIDHLGDDPLNTINTNIDIILEVPKVKKEILQSIKTTWLENTVKAQITVFLQQYGISNLNVAKIYEKFGAKAVAIITKNPYTLIREINGIGFKIADKIALNLGIEKDSDLRLSEALKFILNEGANFGNCYLLLNQLLENIRSLININDPEKIISSIKSSDEIIVIHINSIDRYYSKPLYDAEQNCLKHINNFLNIPPKLFSDLVINDDVLSLEQKTSVYGALSHNISILTGGPGCGKSFSTKSIVDSLINAKKSVGICAPTGKAAIRSSTLIGREAVTIHRLLAYNPGFGGFTYNADNQLTFDYIIVEESSMIDIKLMSSLLDAIDYNTQVLFVGDHNQLPPVGAGAPFKDMIESGLVPTFKLSKIFRQGVNSKIITTAHSINTGEYPHIESPISNPEIWKDETDCMFIDSGVYDYRKPTDYPKDNTLAYNLDIKRMLVKLYTETIKKYRGYEDVQILIPKRVGDLGTNEINLIIRDAVNPMSETTPHIKLINKEFRLNDKVIHIRNNYELGDDGVFNGEIGKIIKIDMIKKTCVVKYDDKEVDYTKGDISDLELAYCISIHKSQGSEFQCVIIPLMSDYGIMLEKSLVYTGLTRGKKLAIFIGQRQALMKSIKTVNTEKRQTSLSELLIQEKSLVYSE